MDKRDLLLQVEPKLGLVLLGYRHYDPFHRGLKLEIIELLPEDAIKLANQLASAADLIMTTTQELQHGQDSINANLPPTPSTAPSVFGKDKEEG